MKYTDELLNELKIKYNINKDYKVFELQSTFYSVLAKTKGVKEARISAETYIINHNKEDERVEITTRTGVAYGEDFTAVRLEYVREYDARLHFVFCKDFKELYTKYLKGNYKIAKPLDVGPGIYKPKDTQQGWTLIPVPIGNVIKPILNDNLYEQVSHEITAFNTKEKIYNELKVDYKRGIMLFGPPGNGKTSFIKTLLSSETKAISVLINSSDGNIIDFMEYFMTLEHLRDTLKIIVFEDIDGMRGDVRSLLLNFLDGIQSLNKTIFIATTNYPDRVDSALKDRPSRFDSLYKIDCPNKNSRLALLTMYFPELSAEELQSCIVESKGFSGAYFKEFYLTSKLNDLTPLASIMEIKRRKSLCFFD